MKLKLTRQKKQQEDVGFGSFGHDGNFPAVSAPFNFTVAVFNLM